MSQEEAVLKFENFLQGSQYLVCHDSVDFVTVESLLSRLGQHSESYERIERRDSQEFYKFVMRRDFQSSRYGMKAIVERFGDPRTKAQYKDSARGALFDAETLAKISTTTSTLDSRREIQELAYV